MKARYLVLQAEQVCYPVNALQLARERFQPLALNLLLVHAACVEAPGLLPEPTLRAFRERLDLGYVYVRFTDTRGGTDIGFPIDTRTLDLSQVDLENGSGTVRLSGALTLDDIDVRCIADIDVATLAGVGHLEVVRA